MPPDRDRATLLDVTNAARLVVEFVEGMDFAAFQADAKTQSAVISYWLSARLPSGFPAASRRLIPRCLGGRWVGCAIR